jgi:hypothetical protein
MEGMGSHGPLVGEELGDLGTRKKKHYLGKFARRTCILTHAKKQRCTQTHVGKQGQGWWLHQLLAIIYVGHWQPAVAWQSWWAPGALQQQPW